MSLLSQEQLQEVELYRSQHQTSVRDALRNCGYSEWSYYQTKRTMSEQKSQGFIPLKKVQDAITDSPLKAGNPMTMEIRTVRGTEIRLVGEMDFGMIKELICHV